jgi:hypothetical protein
VRSVLVQFVNGETTALASRARQERAKGVADPLPGAELLRAEGDARLAHGVGDGQRIGLDRTPTHVGTRAHRNAGSAGLGARG